MTIRLAAGIVPVLAMMSVSSVAFADGQAPSIEVPRTAEQMPTRYEPGVNGVAANGRCGGVSFGTGARRCGDLSGGPSGGLTNRN